MPTEDTDLTTRLWNHAEAYRIIGNDALAELLEEAAGELEIAIGIIDEPNQADCQRFVERHSTPILTTDLTTQIREIAEDLSQDPSGFSTDAVITKLNAPYDDFPPSNVSVMYTLQQLGYQAERRRSDDGDKRIWLKPVAQQQQN